MKMTNARAIASMAADMIVTKQDYTAIPRSRLAAEFIMKQSDNGVTACAAVLATMGALFDRGGAMVFSAENRADFYNAVLSVITENGGDGMRRHREWIKAWYWLRDGGASSIDDLEWYAAITLQGCKSKPVSGMAAAWQLCTVLRGAELIQAGELYKDGNQPDEAFRKVFDRVAELVRAMVGPAEAEKPKTKPFTVWIADQVLGDAGYTERPFICHVDAVNAAAIEAEALTVYRQSFGLPAEGWYQFAAENGAYVFQVIAGHIPLTSIVNNYDGISEDDAAYLWGIAE